VWYPETGKIVRSRDVTFWEGDEDLADTIDKPKPDQPILPGGGFNIPYIENSTINHRLIEGPPPNLTQRQRQLLEEDAPNDYTIFDMVTGQYEEFTSGRVQTISPTPVPIAERSNQPTQNIESDKITDLDESSEVDYKSAEESSDLQASNLPPYNPPNIPPDNPSIEPRVSS
jgi:hypothetical protein